MKKRLSVLIVAMITMMLCTGCVMSMGPEELDAAYQLKDVSEYQFEVACDMYLEDPLSNTHAAAEYVEAIAVEEGDLRLTNTYTYEELAACFSMVVELNASNLGEYFTLETLPDNDEYNKVQMNAKEGFYVSNVVVMNFMNQNGGYEQRVYEPFQMGGSLGACEKKDTSWTTEKLKTVELEGKAYLYTFTPTEEMWTNYEDTQAIYIASPSENSYGEYTLLEAYENDPTEISYLLRVISETGLLDGGGSSTTPGGGNTPDNGTNSDSGTTPDNGSSEQTPTPTPEPSYPYPFMGKYFVAVVNYGSSSQYYENYGMYIDENYVYFKSDSGEPSKVALSSFVFTDAGNGTYTYSDEYGDGFSYYGEMGYINIFNGGQDGYLLIPVDKSVYDAIGSY